MVAQTDILFAKSGVELVQKKLPFLYEAVVKYADSYGVVGEVFDDWTASDIKYFKALNERILKLTIRAAGWNMVRSYSEIMNEYPNHLKGNFGEAFGMRKLKNFSELFPGSVVMSGLRLDQHNDMESLPDGLVYTITDVGDLHIHLSLEAKTGMKAQEITSQLRRTLEVLYKHSAKENFYFKVFDEGGRVENFDVSKIYFSPFELLPIPIKDLLANSTLDPKVRDEYFRRVVFEVSRSDKMKTMFGEQIPLTRDQLILIGLRTAYSLRNEAGKRFSIPHRPRFKQFLTRKQLELDKLYRSLVINKECAAVFE